MRCKTVSLIAALAILVLPLMSCPDSGEPDSGQPSYLPPARRNNLWHDYTNSDTVIIFVHGIFSDSRLCWYNAKSKTYWPEMVKKDVEHFHGASVFLGGYYTDIDSGPYEVRNAADELFAALKRSISGHPAVLQKRNIVFVCHSTGGIVARYLLERNSTRFTDKNVGLVLIASPSYGSRQADRLAWLADFYNNELGKQLQWGNWTLRDLDARFKDLLYERRIPRIAGVEAYENHFIIHRKWLPDREYVVTEESAGKYFGAPQLLRNTDHFSTVKPDSKQHPGYELLADFFEQDFKRLVTASAETLPQPTKAQAPAATVRWGASSGMKDLKSFDGGHTYSGRPVQNLYLTIYNTEPKALVPLIIRINIDSDRTPDSPAVTYYEVVSIEEVVRNSTHLGESDDYVVTPNSIRIEDPNGEHKRIPPLNIDNLGDWRYTDFARDVTSSCRLSRLSGWSVQIYCDRLEPGRNVRVAFHDSNPEEKDRPNPLVGSALVQMGSYTCSTAWDASGLAKGTC